MRSDDRCGDGVEDTKHFIVRCKFAEMGGGVVT